MGVFSTEWVYLIEKISFCFILMNSPAPDESVISNTGVESVIEATSRSVMIDLIHTGIGAISKKIRRGSPPGEPSP